jgi:hypothetical protein
MSADGKVSRRTSLKVLGFGALGLAGLGSGEAAMAQMGTTAINPSLLQMRLSDPRAVKALGLTTRRLPTSTPITRMVSEEAAAGLTAQARTLTKADLVAMQAGRITPAAAKLTVRDVESIQGAFRRPNSFSIDISCCCCTPCCCAAAVEPELAQAA